MASSLTKMLSVLDMFGPDTLAIGPEDVADKMSLSRATAYRYLKELCDTGLLSRVDGNYTLGPRIIELDWMMRRYDPLIFHGRELMAELATATGLTVYLSVYYEGHIINTHIESAQHMLGYAFGRGRPLPLFKGAQSKVLIAYQKNARIKKIFEENIQHDTDLALSWKEFNAVVKAVRKSGYCITHDELNSGLTGISVPILNAQTDDIHGSIALVGGSASFELYNTDALINRLKTIAAQIAAQMNS